MVNMKETKHTFSRDTRLAEFVTFTTKKKEPEDEKGKKI
jgi:hypothetical protein